MGLDRFAFSGKHSCGWSGFALRPPSELMVELGKAGQAQMVADWQRRRIDIDLPLHPALGKWLLSLYFGLAHEVGHLLWHAGPLTLREAWANYFALHVLEASYTRLFMANHVDRFLLTKDRWLSLGILAVQKHSGGIVERSTANIVFVWRKASTTQVKEFLHTLEGMNGEAASLGTVFSRHFGVPKDLCHTWFFED